MNTPDSPTVRKKQVSIESLLMKDGNSERTCPVCPTRTVTVQCGRCRGMVYCSEACRLRDWKIRHAKECRLPTELNDSWGQPVADLPSSYDEARRTILISLLADQTLPSAMRDVIHLIGDYASPVLFVRWQGASFAWIGEHSAGRVQDYALCSTHAKAHGRRNWFLHLCPSACGVRSSTWKFDSMWNMDPSTCAVENPPDPVVDDLYWYKVRDDPSLNVHDRMDFLSTCESNRACDPFSEALPKSMVSDTGHDNSKNRTFMGLTCITAMDSFYPHSFTTSLSSMLATHPTILLQQRGQRMLVLGFTADAREQLQSELDCIVHLLSDGLPWPDWNTYRESMLSIHSQSTPPRKKYAGKYTGAFVLDPNPNFQPNLVADYSSLHLENAATYRGLRPLADVPSLHFEDMACNKDGILYRGLRFQKMSVNETRVEYAELTGFSMHTIIHTSRTDRRQVRVVWYLQSNEVKTANAILTTANVASLRPTPAHIVVTWQFPHLLQLAEHGLNPWRQLWLVVTAPLWWSLQEFRRRCHVVSRTLEFGQMSLFRLDNLPRLPIAENFAQNSPQCLYCAGRHMVGSSRGWCTRFPDWHFRQVWTAKLWDAQLPSDEPLDPAAARVFELERNHWMNP